MKRSWIVLGLWMVLAGAASAQDVDKKTPVPPQPEVTRPPLEPVGVPTESIDLLPGDEAPDFRLDSSQGGAVRRSDLKGHWSVLVFAETRTPLGGIRAAGDSLGAMGVRLYGVCPDGVGALKTYAERERIGFPLLSDLTGQISQLFGMYDDQAQVIRPGLVIVDAQGLVRMVIQGPSLHADDILQMVKHTVRGA